MSENIYPYQPDTVTSPGVTLQEILEAKGMTQSELSERMIRPLKTISEIIHGKTQITPETAVQLENVLGLPAIFWLNRESRYQEYIAKKEEIKVLQKQIPLLEDLPLRNLRKRNHISKTKDKIMQVKEVMSYYSVNHLSRIEPVYFQNTQYLFRKSESHSLVKGHLAAWIKEGELLAEEIDTFTFNAQNFKKALNAIRHLTMEKPGVFIKKMQHLCAESGVAFVLVPQYPKCRTSGLARWLRPDKALIQLSLRYKTDDHFWFSFFHEAAHLLKHSKKATFLDDYSGNDNINEIEEEANEFASDTLIPLKEYKKLKENIPLSKDDVKAFAHHLQISPGIIVGRLQHDGIIPFHGMNDLKRKFDWKTV